MFCIACAGFCLTGMSNAPVIAVGSFIWSKLLKPVQRASAFFANMAAPAPLAEQTLQRPAQMSAAASEGPSMAEVRTRLTEVRPVNLEYQQDLSSQLSMQCMVPGSQQLVVTLTMCSTSLTFWTTVSMVMVLRKLNASAALLVLAAFESGCTLKNRMLQ